jgi:hypothetical protein
MPNESMPTAAGQRMGEIRFVLAAKVWQFITLGTGSRQPLKRHVGEL